MPRRAHGDGRAQHAFASRALVLATSTSRRWRRAARSPRGSILPIEYGAEYPDAPAAAPCARARARSDAPRRPTMRLPTECFDVRVPSAHGACGVGRSRARSAFRYSTSREGLPKAYVSMPRERDESDRNGGQCGGNLQDSHPILFASFGDRYLIPCTHVELVQRCARCKSLLHLLVGQPILVVTFDLCAVQVRCLRRTAGKHDRIRERQVSRHPEESWMPNIANDSNLYQRGNLYRRILQVLRQLLRQIFLQLRMQHAR